MYDPSFARTFNIIPSKRVDISNDENVRAPKANHTPEPRPSHTPLYSDVSQLLILSSVIDPENDYLYEDSHRPTIGAKFKSCNLRTAITT